MPITRTAMVDDDGSGTTGTIINNAWKQELYNQIDGLAGAPVTAWTPTDASGAGLVFTTPVGKYCVHGKMVTVWGSVVYPATANGANASIGGLPFFNALGFAVGFYQTYGVTQSLHLANTGTTILILNPTTFAQRTNAQVSGQVISFTGAYIVA